MRYVGLYLQYRLFLLKIEPLTFSEIFDKLCGLGCILGGDFY